MDTLQEKKRQLFFTNLLLLGFDVNEMEEKYHIAFDKDMFQLPNKKGFEVVTHFLFMKINGTMNKKEYRIIWPIFSKDQEQEFRKTCFMHLNSISQEDPSIKFPRMVQSLFLSPGGERFYELYLVFSTYALKKIIEKERLCMLLSKPIVNIQNSSTVKDILRSSTNVSAKKFIELQKELLKLQEKWQECAESFIACYRKSKINMQEKQRLHNEEKNKLSISVNKNMNANHSFQDILQESNKQLYEIQNKWKTLEEFLLKEKHYWETVKSEVEPECTEKYHLNGNKYIVQIPEILIKDCKDQLRKREIRTTEDNGKLCIKNFINLFNICMEYYAKILHEEHLPKLNNLSASLKEYIKEQTLNLDHLQSLSKKLGTEVIPDSKNCVDKMESIAYERNKSLDYQLSVQFPPATPPMVFSPNIQPGRSVLPESGLKLTPATGKTPNELIKRIPVRHIRKPHIYNMKTLQPENPWEFQGKSFQNISNILTSGSSLEQNSQEKTLKSCYAMEVDSSLGKGSDESDSMIAVSPLKCILDNKYLPLERNEDIKHLTQKYNSIKPTVPETKINTVRDMKSMLSTISKTRTDEDLSRTRIHKEGEKDNCNSLDQVKSKQIVNTILEENKSITSNIEKPQDSFKWKNEAGDIFDEFNDDDMLEAVTLPSVPYFNIYEDIEDPCI